MALPAFSRRVLDSANAIPVNGSTSGVYTFSGSHSESTRACSSRSTAAANPSAVPAGPRDIPIRTFMGPIRSRRAAGGRVLGCRSPRAAGGYVLFAVGREGDTTAVRDKGG